MDTRDLERERGGEREGEGVCMCFWLLINLLQQSADWPGQIIPRGVCFPSCKVLGMPLNLINQQDQPVVLSNHSTSVPRNSHAQSKHTQFLSQCPVPLKL